MTEGNPVGTTATWTQCQGQATSGLDRIREAARREPSLRFTCLMHHVTVDLLRDAYFALRRNAAPGLDGVTWAAYGEVIVVRYADDFVLGFQYRDDAERLLAALRERFARFGLELNDEKTRLIEFGRFAATNRKERGDGKPETFDFLGFTHLCGTRRSDGRFTVHRQTNAKRLRTKAKAVREQLLRHRTAPIPEQGSWLRSVVQGFFNYHAVPGNGRALDAFRTLAQKAWLRALRRRSQRGMRLTWPRVKRLIRTWLPSVRILHPYPNVRLCVAHPR